MIGKESGTLGRVALTFGRANNMPYAIEVLKEETLQDIDGRPRIVKAWQPELDQDGVRRVFHTIEDAQTWSAHLWFTLRILPEHTRLIEL